MAKTNENCGNCKFMRVLTNSNKELTYTCCRTSPHYSAACIPTPQGPQWATYTGQPIVAKDTWCGEWKPELNS